MSSQLSLNTAPCCLSNRSRTVFLFIRYRAARQEAAGCPIECRCNETSVSNRLRTACPFICYRAGRLVVSPFPWFRSIQKARFRIE